MSANTYSHTVAILMSIYKNDRPDWIEQSINSMLEQSYNNVWLFLAVDGVVSEEVSSLLDRYESQSNVEIFHFEKCKGLATRLNFLIDKALSRNDIKYLARMDADDVSHVKRIEKQVEYLESSNVDVLGSSVIEIDEDGNYVFLKKAQEHDLELKKNIILRCPFNHPTVVFKREVFDAGLRYDSNLLNTQDYKLWVDMAAQGFKFGNCTEPLLYFRVSDNFHSRRTFKKAKNDFLQRIIAMKKLNVLSVKNMTHTLSLLLLRVSPKFVSKFAYKYLR